MHLPCPAAKKIEEKNETGKEPNTAESLPNGFMRISRTIAHTRLSRFALGWDAHKKVKRLLSTTNTTNKRTNH